MGGGSNSSPPVDTPPGGGTYPVDQYGNAYNPAWGGGTDYSGLGSALGKGLTKGLAQYQAGATDTHNYMTGAGDYKQPGIPGASVQQEYVGTQHGSMIPDSGAGRDNTDLMAALKRLLGGLG